MCVRARVCVCVCVCVCGGGGGGERGALLLFVCFYFYFSPVDAADSGCRKVDFGFLIIRFNQSYWRSDTNYTFKLLDILKVHILSY